MTTVLTKREQTLRYEKPWKTILIFCLPTVFLMIVQGLYNILDKSLAQVFAAPDAIHNQYYIDMYNELKGTLVNEIPLADMRSFINVATQYASQTYNLLWAFSVMFGMGCAMNFSIAFGKRDTHKMQELSGNAFAVTTLFSILISFIIFSIVYPGWGAVFITSQMGSHFNPITQALCWNYTIPMLLATPMMFLSYYFISLIRSEGRMKWVMAMVVSSLAINAGVAIFFMRVVHLEMAGAMLGTVFSWIVQVIWGFFIVFKTKDSYAKFTWANLVNIKLNNIWQFMRAGFPNFIINGAIVITSYVSTMLVVQLPNQDFNDGVSVLQELYSSMVPWMTLILSAGIGMTQGSRTILAYNFGAEKYQRIWQILKRVSIIIIAWFVLMLIVIISFGQQMMELFAFPHEYAVQYRWWIVINFATYPFCGFTYIALTLFQGINRSFLATLTSSLRTVIVILPLIGIGYAVSVKTGNPIFFYIFIGLTDLCSAAIIIPILAYFWFKYQTKLVDKPDNYEHDQISESHHLKKTKKNLANPKE
ncbi:MATE family efflux transporter [Spiroplasma chrysopicola]|uniref:MATE efflux family protein n=1 Tax=Spiroplasma chrysopicola DF-1 TaxID=1276227 RepID=R4UAI4_9MOLU|nr:MATE family efflux transporter [Spiroplasma chrysopicola]AGM24924.1 MATE efflux family protein [Spiroplasma chrysopicola DF-1]